MYKPSAFIHSEHYYFKLYRMKTIFLSLLLTPFLAFSQRDWESIEIKHNPVTENISFLTGSGGNIGVIYGTDGVMIIDDQFAPLSEKIKNSDERQKKSLLFEFI